MGSLYCKFTNPQTGERLGRRPPVYDGEDGLRERVAAKIAAQLAAEPDATAERREEIRARGLRDLRAPVHFFDPTFTVPKSVSVLHAAYQHQAQAARAGGDEEAAAGWAAKADTVVECVRSANAAMLAEAQRTCGYTRSGAGGVLQEDAHEWIVASFLQHTSRDGDPHLHVHNPTLNRVWAPEAGKWLTLDGRHLFAARPALSTFGDMALREELIRRLGVAMVAREDGNNWEVAGVTAEIMEEFSSRRNAITPELEELATAYEAKHGARPNQYVLAKMKQHVQRQTRAAKPAQAPPREQLLAAWEQQTTQRQIQLLSQVPGDVDAAARGHAGRSYAYDAIGVITAAVADAQSRKSTWTRDDLVRSIGRCLPEHLPGIEPGQVPAMVEDLADLALTPGGGALCVTAPDPVPALPGYRLADGTSKFGMHGAARYASVAHLDMETQILARARERGAVTLDHAEVARLVGADRDRLEAQLRHGGDGDPAPVSAAGLSDDQAAAIYGILTSGRSCEVLTAPAGTGKSFLLARLNEILQQTTGARVVGVATGTAQARVLQGEGLATAHNIAAFLGRVEGSEETRGHLPLRCGDILAVDESSTLSTQDLADLQEVTRRVGAKLLLTGDEAQLTSPAAGGAMRLLATELGRYELHQVRRFLARWERTASLRLRAGDAGAMEEYYQRGRVRHGSTEDMEGATIRQWLASYVTGRDVIMMAGSNGEVARLSARARGELVALGLVAAEAPLRLMDGNLAGVGDRVRARKNQNKLQAGEPGHTLANRDLLRVEAIDGLHVTVRRQLDNDGGWSAPFTVTSDYLASHGELGYASNTFVALGSTTRTAGTLASEQMSREQLYVALSRATTLYAVNVPTDRPAAADRPRAVAPREPARELAPADWRAAVAGILARESAELTALETIEAETEQSKSVATLAPAWREVTRTAAFTGYDHALRAHLDGESYARYLEDPERATLHRQLRAAELAGHDIGEVLARASRGSMTGARSVAAVLHARVSQVTRDDPPAPAADTYAARTPPIADPQVRQAAQSLAARLDERVRELGQRTAAERPRWAVQHLGEPSGPEWERRAGLAAASRGKPGSPIRTWRSAQRPSSGHPSGGPPTGTRPRRWTSSRPASSCAACRPGNCSSAPPPTPRKRPASPLTSPTRCAKPRWRPITPAPRPTWPGPGRRRPRRPAAPAGS